MYLEPFFSFLLWPYCLNFFIHEINFTKLPIYENFQNTSAGSVVRCDKQKWGYTKKVMYWCLVYYQNVNAQGPPALGHLNPGSTLIVKSW